MVPMHGIKIVRAFLEPHEFSARSPLESGGGPPHSKTLARWPRSRALPPGFGVRRLCGALVCPDRFMVPMHAKNEWGLTMITLQRVLFLVIVCVVFGVEFKAASAESLNDRRVGALEKLVRDDSPRVRLEALRALAKIPSAKSAELALNVLDKPMDPFLDYALWLTINDLADPWIAAIKSGEWKVEDRKSVV